MDFETIMSPGFVLLLAFSWGATIMGYFLSRSWGTESLGLGSLIFLLVGEIVACAVIAAKMFD